MSHRSSASEKVRLYFVQQSGSGKAYQFYDAAKRGAGKKHVWIPKSLIDHISKFPKGESHDYAEWELTVPAWVTEEKGL